MRERRFLTESPLSGDTLRISGDEYHHLKTVNRAKCGDSLEVINGQGSLFFGEIRAMKSNEALVQVLKEEKSEKPPARVIIAVSLLKQRPMNLLIEKLSEMGIDVIRPLIFTRTDEPYSPSRLKKWQRIAAQSLKVNKRLWQTEIYPPATLKELIQSPLPVNTKILLDISGTKPADIFQQVQFPVISVIGPPGDMTDQERQFLIENRFTPYNISDCILKSETAAMSIAAILSYTSGSHGE